MASGQHECSSSWSSRLGKIVTIHGLIYAGASLRAFWPLHRCILSWRRRR